MTGGTPARSKPEYFDGNIKWLVSGDVHQKQIFDCEGRISKLGMQNSNARVLPVNSVIIALNGQGKTRGTVAMLRTQATCNQSLVSITPKEPDTLLAEFIFLNLQGRYEEIRRITGDAGNERRGLNMRIIRGIEIPFPPLEEQRRIVAVLDEAFEGLDRARTHAEANLLEARGLLRGIEDKLLSPTQSTPWVSDRIENCIKVKSGNFLPKRGMASSGPIPVYGGNGRVGYHDRSNLKGENVLIGRVGAKCGNIHRVSEPIWLTDNALYVSEKRRNFDNDFLALLLNRADLRNTANQAAQPVISYKTIKPVKLTFPKCLEEQERIIGKYVETKARNNLLAEQYNKRLTDLDDLRQSLLQRAFAGELT